MNRKPINKDNPKNIYCSHCKHWEEDENIFEHGTCINPESIYFLCDRAYWCRCKCFEWR